MVTYFGLSRDEVEDLIPYKLVATTLGCCVWNTGKRKRLMKQYFTDDEIKTIDKLRNQARDWYLYHGVPEEVQMSQATFALWIRLGDFCTKL